MASLGLDEKIDYIIQELERDKVVTVNDRSKLSATLSRVFGHDALEQVLTPWHVKNPDLARELLIPSRLYGKVMYGLLGDIDKPANVDITGAAHISGGGIPEKAQRMVEPYGLGVAIDAVFPDPPAVTSLMEIAKGLPQKLAEEVDLDDRTACQQWNRGIGLLVVADDIVEARKIVNIAEKEGREAAIAGEIIDKPQIEFHGHTWSHAA